VKIADNT